MAKRKIYSLEEIFTPSAPANYTFIERKSVTIRLDRGLRVPGRQIIIYGHSGAGKTTLLKNKFKEKKINCITTRCIGGMSLSDIVKDAFNQLEIYFTATAENSDNGKIGGGLSASYFGIKASISSEVTQGTKSSLRRAVELPITPQTLAKYIGESGNVWVIEDFHKINQEEKAQMAQIMKVFMDNAVEYPKLKIIAIGAVNTAREVVQYDPEMKNRISEIEVPLMKKENLESILSKGEELLNINLHPNTRDRIVAYSSGLPAVTHQLAFLICEANEIEKTYDSNKALPIDKKTLDTALDEYLAENSDTLRSLYEVATKVAHKRKSENPADIIKAILSTNKETVFLSDIKHAIQRLDKEYVGNNLKKYVDELTTPRRSEILRYNKESASYYFSSPFIKAFCQCHLRNDITTNPISESDFLSKLRSSLDKELELARKMFLRDFEFDDLEMGDVEMEEF